MDMIRHNNRGVKKEAFPVVVKTMLQRKIARSRTKFCAI